MKLQQPESQQSTPVNPPNPKHLPFKQILGSLLGISLLLWLLSKQKLDELWLQLQRTDPRLLLVGLLLVAINMGVRAIRWQVLLGTFEKINFWRVFSVLMVGYLANTILPARAGDLVRVCDLAADSETLSRSRILSTVFVERVLDMVAIVVVLCWITWSNPLPHWLRKGTSVFAIATVIGLLLLAIICLAGERVFQAVFRPLQTRFPKLVNRLRGIICEFSQGINHSRDLGVLVRFFAATFVLWALEIDIVLVVAYAFKLPLTGLDAAILMLFSLFASLIPALPGQIGTFELAIVTGLQFLGFMGSNALPFALTLHLLLLGGTAIIGLICLIVRGSPIRLSSLTPTVKVEVNTEIEE